MNINVSYFVGEILGGMFGHSSCVTLNCLEQRFAA